jgi:phage terminase large subunit
VERDPINPNFQWCELFDPLLEIGKYRFKGAHGGRAGMKTEHFGAGLLSIAESYRARILCTREIQNSIDESVHQTLADIIEAKELNFTVQKQTIYHNKTGSEFLFKGLSKMTANSIKSMAKIDIAWVEEAHAVSQRSWDILIPTIRKKGSEIWASWNPELDDDPVWVEWVDQKQDDYWILTVNYWDNPWFDELPIKKDMEKCKRNNPSKYRHIWCGEPVVDSETLVYRFNRDVNIINYEPKYNEGFETWCSWDFGTADDTAIIFYQLVPTPENDIGFWIFVFDEYVNNNKSDDHYRDVVDKKGYLIDHHACDPAGANRQSDLKSWVDKLQKNPKTGNIDWNFQWKHSRYSVKERVDMTNDIIPFIKYNRFKTQHFHKMAFNWHNRTDKNGKMVLPITPEHDEFSHMGVSLYYFVENRFPPRQNQKVRILH